MTYLPSTDSINPKNYGDEPEMIPEVSEDRLPQCPVCGHQGLAALCDPAGVGLCPQCGRLLHWFQGRLASIQGIEAARLALDTMLVDDLGMDSLELVEIIMEIEDEFGVRISEEEADEIRTIADAIHRVAQAMNPHVHSGA